MGTEACIRKTRIPVWLLVSYRRQSATDAHILEGDPDRSAVDLVHAFSYLVMLRHILMILKEEFENRKRHKLWQIFIPRPHKALKQKYFTILNQACMNGQDARSTRNSFFVERASCPFLKMVQHLS